MENLDNVISIGNSINDLPDVMNQHFIFLLMNRFAHEQELEINIRETFPNIYSASTLVNILNNLGWEVEKREYGGWEGDCWIDMYNDNYDFDLTVYYSGYYGDISLHRTDWEDGDIEAKEE